MMPTTEQVTIGATALSARIPDPSATHHEQVARSVLTPVLSDIEARLSQMPHDNRCVWWTSDFSDECSCLVGDALHIVRGRR